MRRHAFLLVMLCAGALFASCTTNDRNAAQNAATKAVQNLNSAAQSMATSAPVLAAKDALLATTVKARLVAADVDSAGTVGVAAHRGVVTLTGAVRSPRDIATLRDAARHVAGVKDVRVALHADPRLPSARQSTRDIALAARVMAGIAAQAGTNALRVHAGARGGIITLDGTAPTAAVKATIVSAAAKTPGVRRVIDRMQVHA